MSDFTIIKKPAKQNISKRKHKIQGACIHISQSANGGLAALDRWFASSGCTNSAFFGIGKKGQVHQYINLKDVAWTQGLSWRSGVPYNPYGKKLTLSKLAPIVREHAGINPNQYLVGIEHEGNSGESWTDAMYRADAWLLVKLSREYGFPLDRKHVIGHYQIDHIDRPGCPGKGFSFDVLIAKYIPTALGIESGSRIKERADGTYYVVEKGGWRASVIEEIIKYGFWSGTWKEHFGEFNRLNPATPHGGWIPGQEVKVVGEKPVNEQVVKEEDVQAQGEVAVETGGSEQDVSTDEEVEEEMAKADGGFMARLIRLVWEKFIGIFKK